MKTKYEKLLDISRTYYTKTSNLRASIFKFIIVGVMTNT